MSTRANIRFENSWGESIHIDRSHDGFPDVILPDIKKAIDNHKDCCLSGDETGQLVSCFLGMHYEPDTRVQPYEPCIGFEKAGDESYCYWVKWNKEKKEYEYGVE